MAATPLRSWVSGADASDFPLAHLPLGVRQRPDGSPPEREPALDRAAASSHYDQHEQQHRDDDAGDGHPFEARAVAFGGVGEKKQESEHSAFRR